MTIANGLLFLSSNIYFGLRESCIDLQTVSYYSQCTAFSLGAVFELYFVLAPMYMFHHRRRVLYVGIITIVLMPELLEI